VKNIFFGAIWCDLVRLGANGGGEFKVQSSRFKVQPGTGRGKNCRFGPPSSPVKPCWTHVFTLIDFRLRQAFRRDKLINFNLDPLAGRLAAFSVKTPTCR
jgi:hypothetical protein